MSSEDCLYLNIWTSAWPPQGKRPVRVSIPGGGNLLDAASQPQYDGESLAKHGVLLVSLNYRLGSFGFFAHPALTRVDTVRIAIVKIGDGKQTQYSVRELT